MKLDRIEVKGFKSIRELALDLRPLNVLIGANGAGKSNFIALFKLLNEMVEKRFQLYVKQNGGAETFLYFGSKTTNQIFVYLTFGSNAYRCSWVPTIQDSLVFGQEEVFFHNKAHYSSPFGYQIGTGNSESTLMDEAEKPASQIERYVLRSLRNWKVYHFHDTSDSAPVKKIGDLNDNLHLRGDASNLGAFLYSLSLNHKENYQLIRDTVRMVAPFFDDFLLRPMTENRNKIQLEWRERESDFPFLAHHLSDGTLRFICLATLLLQPKLPDTILIDEPELGLHPYAINTLASLMRSASTRTQLIVSTQSVPLVNRFEPQDLLVVDRVDHATEIRRPEPDSLAAWLQEYSLGELWEKNVLGGRPSR